MPSCVNECVGLIAHFPSGFVFSFPFFSTFEVKERRCDCPSGPSALVITERKRGRAQSRSFLGILGQTRCFVPGGSLQDRCCVTCAQTHAHTTTSSRPAILFSLLDYMRTRLLVEPRKRKQTDGGCSSDMSPPILRGEQKAVEKRDTRRNEMKQ